MGCALFRARAPHLSSRPLSRDSHRRRHPRSRCPTPPERSAAGAESRAVLSERACTRRLDRGNEDATPAASSETSSINGTISKATQASPYPGTLLSSITRRQEPNRYRQFVLSPPCAYSFASSRKADSVGSRPMCLRRALETPRKREKHVMSFGDRVRRRRLSAQLRQTDFLEHGLTQSQLSLIENGTIGSPEKIDQIAAALKVASLWLVTGTEVEAAYVGARFNAIVVGSARCANSGTAFRTRSH